MIKKRKIDKIINKNNKRKEGALGLRLEIKKRRLINTRLSLDAWVTSVIYEKLRRNELNLENKL